MKTMLVFLLLIFSLSLFADSRKADDDLSLALAQQRMAQVSEVRYFLNVDLDKNKEGYTGTVVMELVLNDMTKDLSIDTMVDKVKSVQVNGVMLKKYPKRKGSLDLPKTVLTKTMKVEIAFANKYSSEASGFQRVIDPEDKNEYLYTDFEPYQAHKFFPCLDQPDLKARFNVTVSAPKEWTVIGNDLIATSKGEGNKTRTMFRETPPISTYLFFLGAGPFVLWEDKFEKIPLHLYARQSIAKYVDEENIFATTKKGLKFFNEYFDMPYPFSKYGQVFIPEFAWGGMENPGAVTMNERNIFRGPVPKARLADRDDLILHEMAHMWFGDLVTMEWWNDLWLNESFATYLASIAQERAMSQDLTWLDFFTTKAWGYWQDKLVTTHPIETPVPDVRTARGNFDGITYAKGASALKQLHFFAGDKGFREGLRTYFKTYAWKNTRRADFVGAIAAASKVNLDDWTEKWLKTAGPNEVEIQFACEKDKVSMAILNQKVSVSNTLSPHRVKIGLYEIEGNDIDHEKTIEVLYTSEKTELKEMIGQDCPDFVMPNEDDKDYALFSLDAQSLSKAKIAIINMESSLNRLMIWNILSEMLRDQKLGAQTYFDLVAYGLENEKSDDVLGFILGRHGVVKDQYQLYLTKAQRAEFAPRMEEVLWKRTLAAKAGSSLQMTFFDFYIASAQTEKSGAMLLEMIKKNTPPAGIVLDQERRWALILNLSQNGHPEALKLSQAELKKDKTTMGVKMDAVAHSSFPELKSKKNMWKRFYTDKKLPYSTFKESGSKIHTPNHPELSEPFVNEYFKKVTTMDWSSHDDVVDIYFEQLFPVKLCNEKTAKMSSSKLKGAKNLTSLARRSWLEAQDELERCVKVRNTMNTEKL